MSLEFVGLCVAFHYQYFQMVDILIQNCKMNVKKSNPHAKTHEPMQEEEETIAKEKDTRVMKIMKGDDFGWKFPSKNTKNINAHSSATPSGFKNNNACSLFEDEEDIVEMTYYEMKENEDEDNRKVKPSKDGKTKVKFDVEDMSREDIEAMLCKYNEKHPEDSACAGIFKYASELEKNQRKRE